MSNDPLGGGVNRYQYCGNNPLNLVDPNGSSALNGAVGTETWEVFNSQGALRGSGSSGFGNNNAAEQFLHGDFCIEGICSAPQ